MSTRAFTAAAATAITLLAAAPRASGQQDSIDAQVDSVLAVLRARSPAGASGIPVAFSLSTGYGALHSPCPFCSASGAAVELTTSLRVTPALELMVSRGVAFPGEQGSIGWNTLNLRLRPTPGGRFFVQVGAGSVQTSYERTYTVQYESTDFSTCEWVWVFVLPLPANCESITKTRTETEHSATSGLVVPLAIGYELPLGRSSAIVPQLRFMPGHAGLSGLMLTLRFGGTGTLIRPAERR